MTTYKNLFNLINVKRKDGKHQDPYNKSELLGQKVRKLSKIKKAKKK